MNFCYRWFADLIIARRVWLIQDLFENVVIKMPVSVLFTVNMCLAAVEGPK
jgi:hypothetical protein